MHHFSICFDFILNFLFSCFNVPLTKKRNTEPTLHILQYRKKGSLGFYMKHRVLYSIPNNVFMLKMVRYKGSLGYRLFIYYIILQHFVVVIKLLFIKLLILHFRRKTEMALFCDVD